MPKTLHDMEDYSSRSGGIHLFKLLLPLIGDAGFMSFLTLRT